MRKSGLFFLDSDIFVLLSGASLMRELVAAAGFGLSSARRLQPLPHMLGKKKMLKKYPAGVREKTIAWCSQVESVTARPKGPFLAQLGLVRGIDPGEAELFAVAAETPGSLIATGDKRACRALKAAEGLEGAKAALQGKIICLETALELLLERRGFSALVGPLTQIRGLNKTLGALLSQGELTLEESFREGLDSYSRHLASELGDLLYRPGRER